MLSKNVNNKECAPKLVSFNEKNIERLVSGCHGIAATVRLWSVEVQ